MLHRKSQSGVGRLNCKQPGIQFVVLWHASMSQLVTSLVNEILRTVVPGEKS